jgi:hypothetical protein
MKRVVIALIVLIVLILAISYAAKAQVGTSITSTKMTASRNMKTQKDGKLSTVKTISHPVYDEVYIFMSNHKTADYYARVYKDSAGLSRMRRDGDSLNRLHKHLRQPGGMELHNDKESIYISFHPSFLVAGDAKPSQWPAIIWARPDKMKLKALKSKQ